MKKSVLSMLLIMLITIGIAQSEESVQYGYRNYNEFKLNQPSLILEFKVKRRSGFDIFMIGGIRNYKIRNIKLKSDKTLGKVELWGVQDGSDIYINSYLYSKIYGFNKILENGYYPYFIGEPAREENEQRELGITTPNGKKIPVCCQAGYIILPDGKIKMIKRELLLELIRDNEDLFDEARADNIEQKDVLKMFEYLKRYNEFKKK